MALKITYVESSYVQQVWPKIKDYIQAALGKGSNNENVTPDYTIEHVQSYLANGEWLLVVAADEENNIRGCATISFLNYPLHRVAFMTSVGGRGITYAEEFEEFKTLLKAHGATKIQGYGRDSMVRLGKQFNFQSVNTLVEVEI